MSLLRTDEDGTIRVEGSRITLDVVIRAYERGESPEQIARNLDTLALETVHEVLTYYLEHRAEVQTYLKKREAEAAALKAQIGANRPRPLPPQEELLARWARQQEKADAPTPQ